MPSFQWWKNPERTKNLRHCLNVLGFRCQKFSQLPMFPTKISSCKNENQNFLAVLQKKPYLPRIEPQSIESQLDDKLIDMLIGIGKRKYNFGKLVMATLTYKTLINPISRNNNDVSDVFVHHKKNTWWFNLNNKGMKRTASETITHHSLLFY